MLPKDKTVNIIINQKNYLISTHFSVSDNKKYIAELSVGNNYKQAISIIVYDKLKQNNVGLYPSMQDVMDTEDIAFTDYIFAVVTNAAELQTIFKETDSDLAITERFGIAYEFVRKKDGCFNASNHIKL